MKAENRSAAYSILSQAPFNINDIAGYQIVEFIPTMFKNEEWEQMIK